MTAGRDLNADWHFTRDAGTTTVIDLPHDAMIAETRDPQGVNGTRTGYFPGGRYRYDRTCASRTAGTVTMTVSVSGLEPKVFELHVY